MTRSFLLLVVPSLLLCLYVSPEEGLTTGGADRALPLISSHRPAPIQRNDQYETRIIGVVVAYNEGVVLTDGPCRQLLVVRTTRWRGNPKNRYILVRRDYGCDAGALPARMFQGNPSWKFSLIRDSTCDHSFAEIKDIVQMNPAGGPYRIPIMKRVAGVEGDKMPTTVRFACYRLTREVEPSVRKERVIGAAPRPKARGRWRSDMQGPTVASSANSKSPVEPSIDEINKAHVPTPLPSASPSPTPREELPPGVQEMTFDQAINGARLVDADGDGISNPEDNCPAISNADQKDRDGNGIGDACDRAPSSQTKNLASPTAASPSPTPRAELPPGEQEMTFDQVINAARLGDSDEDGISNLEDNCPAVANADQKDTDGNGIGDACQLPLNPSDASARKRNKTGPKTNYEPPASQSKSRKEPNRTKITGVIVAFDNSVELGSGSCRGTMVFRLKSSRDSANPYIILRRDGSCINLIPEKILTQRRQRRLSVIRSPDCDQPIDELLYFWQLSPTGESSREPRLKPVHGENLEKLPRTYKLPCYLLLSGFP